MYSLEDDEQTLNLTGDTPIPVPRPDVIKTRAAKVAYSYGDASRQTEVETGINAGEEGRLRQEAADADTLDFLKQKNDMIRKVMSERGGNMSPEELSVLQSMTKSDYQSDPKSIFERKFATKFIVDAARPFNHDVLSPQEKAFKAAPEAAQRGLDIYEDSLMTQEFAKKTLQDLIAEGDQMGVVSSVFDTAKAMVLPVFVPGSSSSNWDSIVPKALEGRALGLPGAQKEAIVSYFRGLTGQQFVDEFTQAVNTLRASSITDAQDFVHTFLEYSTFQKNLDNSVAVADLVGLGGLVSRITGAGKKAAQAAIVKDKVPMLEQWTQLRKIDKLITDQDRIVAVPHMLTPKEINAMREALQLPADGRMLAPEEIAVMADNLRVPVPGRLGDVSAFEVEGGRLYNLERGGTVRANKAGPSIHELPRADKTVYVTPEDAARLNREPGGLRIVAHEDGSLSRSYRSGNRWTIDDNASRVPTQSEPKEGLVPVELWNRNNKMGSEFYDVMATEGKITKLHHRLSEADVRPFTPKELTEMAQKLQSRKFTPNEIKEFGRRLQIRQDLQDFFTGMKDSVLAGVKFNKIEDVLAGAGDIVKSGEVTAIKTMTGEPPKPNAHLPSAFDPEGFHGEGAKMSRTFAQRLIEGFTAKNGELEKLMKETLQVPRLTAEAVQMGIAMTKQRFMREYSGRFSDTAVDIKWQHVSPEKNPLGANVDTLVMRLGQFNGTGYTSRDIAEHYFNDIFKLGPEAKIVQEGHSFFIDIAKTIDETDPLVRDQLFSLNKADPRATPEGMWSLLGQHVMSSAGLLSEVQKGNRNIATHVPQVLTKAIKEQISETAKKINAKERAAVARVLEHNRDMPNPATGERGLFYKTVRDFENDFQSLNGRLPSNDETAHYFNYVRVSDFDYAMRNHALYTSIARLGYEEFQLKGSSGFFKGKAMEKFEWSGTDASIWIDDGVSPRLIYKYGVDGQLDQASKKTVDELIEKGAKMVRVFEPLTRPLKDLNVPGMSTEAPINYVLTVTSTRKELSYQQLKYQPGGHSIYRDPWYIKQAVVRPGRTGKDTYFGDNAIENAVTEAQAIERAKVWDTARQMYRLNDPGTAAYVGRNLGMTFDDFRMPFDKGHLDINSPIVHTYEGRSSFDTNSQFLKNRYKNIEDATRSEHDDSNLIDKAFTADRNNVLGTYDANVRQIVPARQLDPYSALNRALAQGVRNLWVNDYKVGAVEQWLSEFGDALAPNFKTQRRSPLYFLFNPQYDNLVAKERKAAAEASRKSIVNYLGVQSEIGADISRIQSKLMDSVYGTFGQDAARFASDHALPFIKDPAVYMRAVAFHTKLGLFNPIQLFVQMNTMANVVAIGGREGLQGASAAPFMTYLRHAGTNFDAHLNKFDKMATNFGWKSGEFKEMYELFQKTGLDEIGGEAALRNDVFDPKFFQSGKDKFLDKGTMFFNFTERALREAGFATAYKEFKKANPTRDLDNKAVAEIMTRGDLLTANMTRASAANWQHGFASVPTQFMAYNLRVAELMLGKRLTTAEKARLFGTYSAFYGVPSAVGSAIAIYPFYDDVKEEAIKRGIDMNDTATKFFHDGIVQTMESIIFGTEHNFAKRYGPGGSPTLRDFMRGDTGVMELLGGASGSIIGDIVGAVRPVASWAYGKFGGKAEYPLAWQDAVDVVSNISSADLTIRAFGILNAQQYRSKSGVLVANDQTTWDAALLAAGLRRADIDKVYYTMASIKEITKYQDAYEKIAQQDFARGLRSASEGDEPSFRKYMDRAEYSLTMGGFQPYQRNQIIQRFLQMQPALEDKVPQDLLRKSKVDNYDKVFETFFKNRKQ